MWQQDEENDHTAEALIHKRHFRLLRQASILFASDWLLVKLWDCGTVLTHVAI